MKYKLKDVFKDIQTTFKNFSESPTLEAEIILQNILKISKEKLVLDNNNFITSKQLSKISTATKLRKMHVPLEYIFRTKDFYRHSFYVDENVLIPRPETEILVDKCLEKILQSNKNEIKILEVGIGSGCIFISIASEIIKFNDDKTYTFYLTDISEKAISIAKKNLKLLIPCPKNCNFKFFKSDIIPASLNNSKIDYIISNPPYIPTDELNKIQKEVQHEPFIALYGGENGLDIYEKLLLKTKNCLGENFTILLEIHPKKINSLKKLVTKILDIQINIEIIKDLNGIKRIMIIYPKTH